MIVKAADDKQPALDTLQKLLKRPDLTASQRKGITKEINIMRAGIKGEKEASYELEFQFKDSKNSILLHDLRLEVNGRVAQIDHLLINRGLFAFVYETKHFNAGIKINDNGEFLSWNSYKKCYEGIPSPIAQNQRHITVLNDFFKTSEMPTRLGIKLLPSPISLVLISNHARIDRPEKFDTSSVIKCDALSEALDKFIDELSVKSTFGGVSRIVTLSTLEKIGRLLKYSHKPIEINYLAKFGLAEEQEVKPIVKEIIQPELTALTTKCNANCSKCASGDTMIVSGRYGYYFKCQDCQGNTAIKLTCKTADCKPKIRKQATRFFEECATCSSSQLYYENRVPA